MSRWRIARMACSLPSPSQTHQPARPAAGIRHKQRFLAASAWLTAWGGSLLVGAELLAPGGSPGQQYPPPAKAPVVQMQPAQAGPIDKAIEMMNQSAQV